MEASEISYQDRLSFSESYWLAITQVRLPAQVGSPNHCILTVTFFLVIPVQDSLALLLKIRKLRLREVKQLFPVYSISKHRAKYLTHNYLAGNSTFFTLLARVYSLKYSYTSLKPENSMPSKRFIVKNPRKSQEKPLVRELN